RRSIIEQAVALISIIPDIENFRCSTMIETDPWGYDSTHKFLNACVAFDTLIPAEKLFAMLRDIERRLSDRPHRDSNGGYVDRELDLDFIAYGTLRLSTHELILPHPRAALRDFVMIPFEEVAPELCVAVKAMLTDNSC
ncbi:MAG: 2-amino-4-hydroxy-6-hydroxymethyldihydropteridine diphosphokinase, partial [Duncaniella sp.]|nr:2-amino-4-hydroxy-6-hydroxymethyldihydropteridine diphosphokinase [Duncaniella sp.]